MTAWDWLALSCAALGFAGWRYELIVTARLLRELAIQDALIDQLEGSGCPCMCHEPRQFRGGARTQ